MPKIRNNERCLIYLLYLLPCGGLVKFGGYGYYEFHVHIFRLPCAIMDYGLPASSLRQCLYDLHLAGRKNFAIISPIFGNDCYYL